MAKSKQATQTVSTTSVPVAPKLQRRFYAALVMLSILGDNRGERVDEEGFESIPDLFDLRTENLRRSFTRSLAYLCDYEKGGHTTTAIALQSTPQAVVFWFASNKCSANEKGQDRVSTFIKQVLQLLARLSPVNESSLEQELFVKAVSFSEKRIAEYRKFLGRTLDDLLRNPSNANIEIDSPLHDWLRRFKAASVQSEDICRMCYDASGERRAHTFEQLRHTIGRLNHTLKAVKVVIAAGLGLRRLFDSYEVKRTTSSPASPRPLSEDTTLEKIAGRMVSGEVTIAQLRAALKEMEQFGLTDKLRKQCQSTTWKPRVHAELLLLDLFWTQELEFVDGDRYIGCSKAACYCCYHYVRAHPGGFVVPACHNNNWLNWKAPEIHNVKDLSLIKTRANILNKMVEKVRLDVLDQVKDRRAPTKRKADSCTEISSVCFGKMRDERLVREEDIEDISEGQDLEILSDVDVGSSTSLDDEVEDSGPTNGPAENLGHAPKWVEKPENSTKDEMNACADVDSDDDSSDGGVLLTAVNVSL